MTWNHVVEHRQPVGLYIFQNSMHPYQLSKCNGQTLYLNSNVRRGVTYNSIFDIPNLIRQHISITIQQLFF
jgi:hypothetical protein